VSKCSNEGEKPKEIKGLSAGNKDDQNDLKRSSKGKCDDGSDDREIESVQRRLEIQGASHPPSVKKALGADELNLAEFPLVVLSRRLGPGQKTVEFQDDVFDEGAKRNVHRRLVISGSDRFGLPTPADTDVLLVLIQLTKQRSNFEARVLSFSRYELVELLRWNHGGSSYQRLEEALQRWVSTTLYYHHAWWDRTMRRWKSKTFHMIDTLNLRGSDREEPGDSLCSITWNEVLFQSFQASNLKALDLDTYFQLKRPAARQAYRFLDKRFYHSSRLEFDLRVFACEHVGLSREHDLAQLRRALEPALKELEEIGFLLPMPNPKRFSRCRRGQHSVLLCRNKRKVASKTTDSESQLVVELRRRGVWADVAPALAGALPEEEVRRYVALHDWLLKRRDKRIAKNPAGFLAACIANRLPFPRDFEQARGGAEVAAQPGMVRKPAAYSRTQLSGEPSDVESASISTELAHLTDVERNHLEAEAVRGAKPFVVSTYERLRKEGGSLFEEVRHSIVVEHLRQRRAREKGSIVPGLREVG
jgi:hypothetical protein